MQHPSMKANRDRKGKQKPAKKVARLPKFVRRNGTGFRAVISVDGRRTYGPTFRTPGEAAAFAVTFKHGKFPERVLTLEDGYKLLVAENEATGKRESTVAFYRVVWERLITRWNPQIGLHKITAEGIQSYARERMGGASPVTASTAWKELAVLQRILSLAKKRGSLVRSPFEDVRKPRIRNVPFAAMSAARISELIDQIRGSEFGYQAERDADLVTLLYLTGLRRGEVGRLRLRDVQLEHDRIFVNGKTGDRYVPISSALRPVLERLVSGIEDPEQLVVGGPRLVEKVLSRWAERLKEPRLTAHVLRVSFATSLARAGTVPFVLKDLLGHESVTQTSRYYRGQSDLDRAAVEGLRLESPARADTRGGTDPVAGRLVPPRA